MAVSVLDCVQAGLTDAWHGSLLQQGGERPDREYLSKSTSVLTFSHMHFKTIS